MDPDKHNRPLPPIDGERETYQVPYGRGPWPQENPPLAPISPPTPAKSKKLLILIVLIVLFLGAIAGAWLLANNQQDSGTKNAPAQTAQGEKPTTDKQGIQEAVNAYCRDLGRAYGFAGMDRGYIISDRFSEEILSDSPNLLRFKQVGNAASATVDCEDARGPNGISNDLLFAKKDGVWTYVDEEQNNAGSGFLCSIADQYNVSKELVKECASSEGAKTRPR